MLQVSSLILVDHEADRPENYRFHCCTNSLDYNSHPNFRYMLGNTPNEASVHHNVHNKALNIHADNYDLHYKGLLAIIVVMKQFELMCYVEEHEEAPKTTHV